MKKQKLIVFFLVVIMGITACGRKIPTLSTLADSGIDQVSEKLIGKSVKDCIDSWGRSEQTWKTEDGQKGYLWFCDQDKTTLILYSDNSGMITSIAISGEVMQ